MYSCKPSFFRSTIDLEDAYAISIHNKSRKYLRFKFTDSIYQFTCLSFGLSMSPWIFTKLLKPVMKSLRTKGLQSVIYLDDILCVEITLEDGNINVDETRKLLERLGFRINEKKSCLEPSTKCIFLGIIINSIEMCIEENPFDWCHRKSEIKERV